MTDTILIVASVRSIELQKQVIAAANRRILPDKCVSHDLGLHQSWVYALDHTVLQRAGEEDDGLARELPRSAVRTRLDWRVLTCRLCVVFYCSASYHTVQRGVPDIVRPALNKVSCKLIHKK